MKKISFIYPPIKKGNLSPLLSQNRQFRFSSSMEVKIFPLVPATTATMLKKNGYEVLFLDGINFRLSYDEFFNELKSFSPDVIITETKAPIFKKEVYYFEKIKQELNVKIIVVGDHATFYPEQVLNESCIDFVVTGGDYDVTCLKLINYLSGKEERIPSGVWFKQDGKFFSSGGPVLIENLDEIPFIDRELTKWYYYGEAYLYHPCMYVLSGRGCGVDSNRTGVCTFCIWQHSLWNKKARLRSPANFANEIEYLIRKYKIKEIFDDNESGPFWNKEWMKGLYKEMDKKGLIGNIKLSSNARGDALDEETCMLAKKIGYRLLKVGLESGNNETLKHICKQETIEQIIEGVKIAKNYGLVVMLTIMTGYPWEKEEDVEKTYEVVKELMLYKTHFGDSLQASVIVPYPGTPLYRESIKNNWFSVNPEDYENFDMSKPVLKSSIDSSLWCKRMWQIHKHPLFLIKSFLTLHTIDDIMLALRGIKSLLGHEKDFGKEK